MNRQLNALMIVSAAAMAIGAAPVSAVAPCDVRDEDCRVPTGCCTLEFACAEMDLAACSVECTLAGGFCLPFGQCDPSGSCVIPLEYCGGSPCPPGETCCNASCGICAPPGEPCVLMVCEPRQR